VPDGATAPLRVRTAAWAAALRPEDIALGAWVAAGQPVLHAAGISIAGTFGDLTDRHDLLLGLIYTAAVVAAIASLGLREPDPSGRLRLSWTENQFGIVFGPFLGGILLLSGIASANVGLPGPAVLAGAVIVAIGVAFASSRLPTASPAARRLLMQPYVFLAAGLFNATVAEISPGLGLPPLAGQGLVVAVQSIALMVGLVAAFGWVFYAMLVYAPRQVADPEGPTIGWVVRYSLFVAGIVVGSSWLRLLGS